MIANSTYRLYFDRLLSHYKMMSKRRGWNPSPSHFHKVAQYAIKEVMECFNENSVEYCVYKEKVNPRVVSYSFVDRCF